MLSQSCYDVQGEEEEVLSHNRPRRENAAGDPDYAFRRCSTSFLDASPGDVDVEEDEQDAEAKDRSV